MLSHERKISVPTYAQAMTLKAGLKMLLTRAFDVQWAYDQIDEICKAYESDEMAVDRNDSITTVSRSHMRRRSFSVQPIGDDNEDDDAVD